MSLFEALLLDELALVDEDELSEEEESLLSFEPADSDEDVVDDVPFVDEDDAERESVTYQPLPLNTMPTG